MMNYREFISTRQASADLREFPECPYGARNNAEGEPAEAIPGFAYCGGSYAIEQLTDGRGFRVFLEFEHDYADLASAEFVLFYWYGRHVGHTVELDLFERMEMACRSSNLDDACRFVQDGLGVESGDHAGIFFSYCEGSNGPNDSNWRKADLSQRFAWMRDYIFSELTHVDTRLTDPMSATQARFGPAIIQRLKGHGFTEFHTGGGCFAMIKEGYADGCYILATNEDLHLPEDGEFILGVCNADGESGASFGSADGLSAPDAIAKALDAIPSIACGQCEGTGETDAMGETEPCPVCDGAGEIKQ